MDQQVATSSCQRESRPSPWELLPAELLVDIFSRLNPIQLERVRLTCHRWNDVVCSTPALMAQFLLWFDSKLAPLSDCHHEQSKMAANVTGQYSAAYVKLGLSCPTGGSPLWAKIGKTIERLTVVIGTKVEPLIDLLRMTPMLKVLKLLNVQPNWNLDHDWFFYDVAGTVDFKLEQLSVLDFHNEFIELFCQICPNLKVLNQKYSITQPIDADILPLIRATQATLQNLSLTHHTDWETCTFDSLHLKELSLILDWEYLWTNMESFLTLISKQSSLEHLRLEVTNCCGVVCEPKFWYLTKGALPKLKSLYLTVNKSHRAALQTFLCDMPLLECLGIEFNQTFGNDLYLGAISNPYLTMLELNSVKLSAEDLSAFFAKTPNIRHLILNSVSGDVMRSVSSLKQLERLEFDQYELVNTDYVLGTVKTLSYTDFRLTSIEDIVTVFPNVQRLSITGPLTDAAVLVLVRDLKQLKHLNLPERSDMTKAVLDHIFNHGSNLERLRIQLDASDILPEQLAGLRKTVRVQIYDLPPESFEDSFSFSEEDMNTAAVNETFSA